MPTRSSLVHRFKEILVVLAAESDSYIRSRLAPTHTVALTIWGEARGETERGQIAVGCVIRNRLNRRSYGATWKKICLKPYQFSCWWPKGGEANYQACMTIARALVAGESIADKALAAILVLTRGIMQGVVEDLTNGADHYMTVEQWQLHPPSWVRNLTPVAHVGHHVFFKLG